MFARLSFSVFLLSTMSIGTDAQAAGLTFDYKDPKEISAVSLTLDSMLEPIVGYAKGISGTVVFDPANPKAASGKIAVEVSSVQFANEGYTATARGYALNGTKYPQIVFTLRKVLTAAKSAHNVYTGTVLADFMCRGITTQMTVPITASYFPGRAEERTNGKYKGDLLVLRTRFGISRKRYGISEGIPDSMVGDTVQVGVGIVGIRYTPGQKAPQTETAQTAKSVTRTYKMEVEERDDPVKADAEFTLDVNAPKATFQTAQGRLAADKITFDGKKLTFHLPDNSQTGAAEGEAVFAGNIMTGSLKTKDGTLKIHGRVKTADDDRIKPAPLNAAQVPEFRDLKIEADGKSWMLTERMRFHHVPAVSLARIENFQVVETGSFGVTNVETGDLVDANTLFQAGGMGSPLVNILAFRLAGLGKIDLKREANSYLKVIQIPENQYTKTRKITVLDLVNSAGGLALNKFTGYRPGAKIPTLIELLKGIDPDETAAVESVSEPGTSGYGGMNGAVLEQVLADAMGKPLPELMQEYLFAPLGLTHSTYEPMPQTTAARKVTLGHYSSGELMLDKFHIYPERGETGLWTTAGEFGKILCEVQRLLAGKPNLLLAPDRRDLLAQATLNKRVLGLIQGDNSYFYHGGDPYGYYANHAMHIKNGYGVIVMENRIMGWKLNNEIIAAITRQHGWDKF